MKEIRSALSPSGSILVPVAETECRRDHIGMIDKNHPLLNIAIQCLELRSEERPCAQEICDRIEYFRSTPDDETQTGDQGLCLDPVKDAGPSCHMEVASKLESAHSTCTTPERVQGEHLTSTTPLRVQGEQSTCTTAEQVQRTRPSQLPAMLPLPSSDLTIKDWKSGDPAPSVVARSSTTVFCGSMLSCIDHLMYDYDVESGKWGAPLKLSAEDCQSSSLLIVSSNQLGKLFAVKNTIIYNVHDGEWIAQGHLKFIPWGALSHEKYVLFFGSQGQVVTIDFSNGSGCEHSSLHTSPSFSCASVKICNGAVYLIGAQSKQVWLKQVYTCPIHELIQKSSWRGLMGKRVSWRELTPLPVSRSTSVVFKDHLLAVGGIANGQAVGDIFLHDEEEHNWEVVSHIPSPRYNCLAEVVGNQLVVVGGWMNHVEKCDLVEIATLNL